MKRCFSYCAIFPKNLVIDADNLIKMWMALGYLGSTESVNDLEIRGKEYFNNLFFQDFVEDNDEVHCKMHDIVHDFAQFLKNTKSQDLDDRVKAKENWSVQDYYPLLAFQAKVYRSLFRQDKLRCETFDSITCIRVLSLSEYGLPDNGPRGIENLIHLRFLAVEWESGRRVPPAEILADGMVGSQLIDSRKQPLPDPRALDH
ncbi:Disease resistance protein [Sesamum alatum]|uniref:Disease resistance protein n=1 Tax=Sesamum alatum TaxID=300844 RepID=A0AAE2CMF5_9LAMI|nr:Disease resistance protein [Sesamum alatum]